MYLVYQLTKEVQVNVLGRPVEVPLSYADGMIGAVPVFDTMASAEAFAGDRYKIAEIQTVDQQEDEE